jgi:hypothetical protein
MVPIQDFRTEKAATALKDPRGVPGGTAQVPVARGRGGLVTARLILGETHAQVWAGQAHHPLSGASMAGWSRATSGLGSTARPDYVEPAADRNSLP